MDQKGKVPFGYAPEYAAIIRAAEDAGTLIIYSSTDVGPVREFLEDFRSLFPKIAVD